MNLNEYKGRSVSESLSSSSHSLKSNTAKLVMVIYLSSAIYRVSHINFLELSVPWEKTSIFLVPWDLTLKEILRESTVRIFVPIHVL